MVMVLSCLSSSAARGESKMVVAVLYFDNNSNDRQYDVLQKGLADMLITDLSGVDSLQIVEREKLQKLLDELKLQSSQYFDPATAQRLGKGVGARYAVTGAISAFDPQMRLDIRLLEVATGKVVMAEKIVGSKDKLFELEQSLVARFVGALDARAPRASTPRAGSVDVKTLLKYSQGVDSADRGDLKAASSKLAEVVSDSPEFALGKEKYTAMVRRLHEAAKRREDALGSNEEILARNIEVELARDIATLEPGAIDRHLAYRRALSVLLILNMHGKGAVIPGRLSYGFIPRDRRATTLGWMKAYFDNTRKLADEIARSRERLKAARYRHDADLDSEDQRRLEELGGERPLGVGVDSSYRDLLDLATFVFAGDIPAFTIKDDGRRTFSPTLAELDPSYVKPGLALFKEARFERERDGGTWAYDDCDKQAEALVRVGRKEEAIAEWQRFLDANPKDAKYQELEKKVEDLLGISKEAKAFDQALEVCKGDALNAMGEAVHRAGRRDGAGGLRRLIAEIERNCKDPGERRHQVETAMYWITEYAAQHNDCRLYGEMQARAEKLEGNPKEYVTKVASGCP
jgi:TolB-like protein